MRKTWITLNAIDDAINKPNIYNKSNSTARGRASVQVEAFLLGVSARNEVKIQRLLSSVCRLWTNYMYAGITRVDVLKHIISDAPGNVPFVDCIIIKWTGFYQLRDCTYSARPGDRLQWNPEMNVSRVNRNLFLPICHVNCSNCRRSNKLSTGRSTEIAQLTDNNAHVLSGWGGVGWEVGMVRKEDGGN